MRPCIAIVCPSGSNPGLGGGNKVAHACESGLSLDADKLNFHQYLLAGLTVGEDTRRRKSAISAWRAKDRTLHRRNIPTPWRSFRSICILRCVSVVSWNSRRTRWNDDRGFWMTLGDCLVGGLAIIRAVCRHRRNVRIDLIEETRNFGDIANVIRRHFHRHGFMRVGIHAEMQLAPSPTRSDAVFLVEPLTFAVNFETGTINKKMQWFRAMDVLRQYQAAVPSAQSGMIGDGNDNPEHIVDRTKQTVGLPQRLVEYEAKRQSCFSGDRRIDWLTAPNSGRWRMPCRHRVLGEPERYASPPDQRGVIFPSVRDPVSDRAAIVLAIHPDSH
jgi:hypothetical protein